MPTYYKPQLVDLVTPWLDVWNLMRDGLLPVARTVLAVLQFYSERGEEPLSADIPLTAEEEAELAPIISALTIAAVQSEAMKPGVLRGTLTSLIGRPGLSFENELPGAVQWELANNIQRASEPVGTFSMDIWGTDQTCVSYSLVAPTEEVIAGAAARAVDRSRENGSAGRPEHPAHRALAERLGPIFGASGLPILRHKEKVVRRVHGDDVLRYLEGGPFFDFLELVLPPLRKFLQERNLSSVTIDTIVRMAIAHAKQGHVQRPAVTPDYSHNAETEFVD
jgi:hypothetical protein